MKAVDIIPTFIAFANCLGFSFFIVVMATGTAALILWIFLGAC